MEQPRDNARLSKRLHTLLKSPVFGLFIVILGVVMLLFYLRYVDDGSPFYLLASATILISIGALQAFKCVQRNNKFTWVIIAVACTIVFSLAIMPIVRFNVFNGTMSPDSLGDYFVAQKTLTVGHWQSNPIDPLVRRIYPTYFSDLSATTLPAFLSKATGINLQLIIGLIYPLIFSLIAIIVFLVANAVFNDIIISSLSCILYSEFYFFSRPQTIHQSTAILFFGLVLLLLFRSRPSLAVKNRWESLLFFLFVAGLVTSHYTVAYIFLILFVSFFIMIYLFRRITGDTGAGRFNELSFSRLSFILGTCFVWFIFVNINGFERDVSAAKESLLSLYGVAAPGSLSNYMQSGYTSGDITVVWYLLEFCLAFLGLLIFALKSRKQPIKLLLCWGAFIFIVMFLMFRSVPMLSFEIGDPNRVLSIGLVFVIPFLSYALIKADKRLKSVLIVVFLLANLFFSLGLTASNNYVLFTNEKSVSPAVGITQVFWTDAENYTTSWMNSYLPFSAKVTCDARSGMYVGTNNLPQLSQQAFFFVETNYLFLNYYNTVSSVWLSSSGATQITPQQVANLTSYDLIFNDGSSQVIFNHGAFLQKVNQ